MICIKTQGLVGRKLKINILEKGGVLKRNSYAAIEFLQDNNEVVIPEAIVDENGNAIFKNLKLRPKKDEEFEKWNKNIKSTDDNKAFLCIRVDAHSENTDLNIIYNGSNKADNNEAENDRKRNIWLDNNNWFEVRPKSPVIVIDPGHGYTKGNVGSAARKYNHKIKGSDGKPELDKEGNPKIEKNISYNDLPDYVLNDLKTWIIEISGEVSGKSERVLTYDVSHAIYEKLQSEGFSNDLYIFRDGENYRDKNLGKTLNERIQYSNKIKADYYISIHADGGTFTSAGAHAIYQGGNDSSKKLGEDIMKYYDVVSVQKDSPKIADNLGIFFSNHKAKRTTLVEIGFITNPKEAKAMFDNIDTMATQLSKGLIENINNEFYGK